LLIAFLRFRETSGHPADQPREAFQHSPIALAAARSGLTAALRRTGNAVAEVGRWVRLGTTKAPCVGDSNRTGGARLGILARHPSP
jgi:hypothetical protein